ncbi:hypothetical protein Esti_001956 [Eimeria stiedai]
MPILVSQVQIHISAFSGCLQDKKNLKDSRTIDELLAESLKNLHVVSMQSLGQLQSFVDSLPALLTSSLKYCRVIFVDDLDLGMASAASFGPQMSQLTEVLRRFLQGAALHGLLMIYGLNRRAAPQLQATMSRVFASLRMQLGDSQQLRGPQQQLHLNTQKRDREGNCKDDASSPPCCFEAWRAPRRFVLHAFRHSSNQLRRSFSWEPSYFICILNAERKALFALKENGQFELVST